MSRIGRGSVEAKYGVVLDAMVELTVLETGDGDGDWRLECMYCSAVHLLELFGPYA